MASPNDYLYHALAFSFQVTDILAEFDEPTRALMRLRSTGEALQPASVKLREQFGKKYTPAWCRHQEERVIRSMRRRLLPPEKPKDI